MFRRNSPRMETILGDGSELKGELSVKGTLRVDGAVEGDVRADWLVVGETGRIQGNVRARGVVVGGITDGNIEADEIVELKQKARVRGEVRAPKLVVSEGAVFDGQSRMAHEKPAEEGTEGRVISLKPPAASS